MPAKYQALKALIIPLRSAAPPKPRPPGEPPLVDPGYGIDLGLGFWGGSEPGVKPQPPAGAHPEHPIYIPPEEPPEPPPVDPGYGIEEGHPDHTLPTPPEPVDPGYSPPWAQIPSAPNVGANWKVTTAWTPVTGWIVVAVPTGPHATPSKRK